MFNPFSKPTPKEQMRENDRALRKAGRELEREKKELEKEEKKIELEIKKLAKEGNKEGCAVLAKQLIQLRKQKTRTLAAGSKVQSIGAQNKAMGTNIVLAGAMGTTSKVMADMNMILNPQQIAKTTKDFSQATMKMEMTDEMINDTMDDILAESGDEDEENQIINQVLDEIGIETSGKMRAAPTPGANALNESDSSMDKDILEKLEKLKAL